MQTCVIAMVACSFCFLVFLQKCMCVPPPTVSVSAQHQACKDKEWCYWCESRPEKEREGEQSCSYMSQNLMGSHPSHNTGPDLGIPNPKCTRPGQVQWKKWHDPCKLEPDPLDMQKCLGLSLHSCEGNLNFFSTNNIISFPIASSKLKKEGPCWPLKTIKTSMVWTSWSAWSMNKWRLQ